MGNKAPSLILDYSFSQARYISLRISILIGWVRIRHNCLDDGDEKLLVFSSMGSLLNGDDRDDPDKARNWGWGGGAYRVAGYSWSH